MNVISRLDQVEGVERMQRAFGRGAVSVHHAAGRNALKDLHQSGCLKLMMPRNHDPVPDVVAINTAGGVTAGDRLSLKIAVGDQAQLRVATQTAERFYRASEAAAQPGQVEVTAHVGKGATLHWLPQESILFDGSWTRRRTSINLHSTSSFIGVESWVLGRVAMGEVLHKLDLSDTRTLNIDGRVRLHDRMWLSDAQRLGNAFAFGENKAVAVVWIAQDQAAERLEAARQFDPQAHFSVVNGVLVGRFASAEPRLLSVALADWLTRFIGRELPRVWTM